MTIYYCHACGWSEQAEQYGRWLEDMRAQGLPTPEEEMPPLEFRGDEDDPPF